MVIARPRIVLTREAQGNAAWLGRLVDAGFAVLDLPVLRFETLPLPEAPIGEWDWVLLTSPHGARMFAESGLKPRGARLGALGVGTAAALAAAGLRDELGLDVRDGAGLARAFLERVAGPCRVLLPGSLSRLPEPTATLAAAGCAVRELAMYRTVPVPPDELPTVHFGAGDVIFFCSPSAVRAFAAAWPQRSACVAIGATTAAAAREAGFEPEVAATPDLEAMIRAAGLDWQPRTDGPECTS